jgi:hypothetical protein
MDTHAEVENNEEVNPLELEQVLRDWASAQSAEQDFSGWKMAAFTMPAQMRKGPFFAPGELVLCRPAPLSGELAERMGPMKPMQVWSFDLRKEVLVSRGMLALQTGPFEEPVSEPPPAPADPAEPDAPLAA